MYLADLRPSNVGFPTAIANTGRVRRPTSAVIHPNAPPADFVLGSSLSDFASSLKVLRFAFKSSALTSVSLYSAIHGEASIEKYA
jgi:hypothetical protein